MAGTENNVAMPVQTGIQYSAASAIWINTCRDEHAATTSLEVSYPVEPVSNETRFKRTE